MLNYKGMSYSIVGDQKVSPTSLNRNIEISLFKSGFNKSVLTFSQSKKRTIKDKIKKLISIKPKLIDLTEYQNLGFQSNLVGVDTSLEVSDNKSVSPRLVNFTEPYEISGVRKTMFYTEVNHGLSIGDRVFIIGGNYDSDLFIKNNKFRSGSDGYKVLFADKCQIVLDIDWDLRNVWELESDDNFIRIYSIENIDEFISAEKALTTRGGTYSRKFNRGQNNILWTNKNWGPVNVWGNSTKITEAPGFFIRTDSPVLTPDNSFNTGTGFDLSSKVFVIKKQSDGKLILGGSFNTYNGIPVGKIVRLNTDGSLDSTFVTGSGFNDDVLTIDLQSDGSIIVGGKFTSYNGSSTPRKISKLDTTGLFDSSFAFNLPPIASVNKISSIAVASDNSIYIGGSFVSPGGRISISKLTPTGSLDFTFFATFGGSGNDLIEVIRLQNDGKLVCGGSFISCNGDVSFRKLIRLNSDGTIDTQNFDPFGFPSSPGVKVSDIYIQSSGDIIVGGNFDTFNLVDANRLIRFDSNCSIDTSFLSNSNDIGIVGDTKKILEFNGDIFVGGNFSNLPKLIKLDSNGELDSNYSGLSNFNSVVFDMVIDSFGKLVVGGNFTFFNNLDAGKIIRLDNTNWQNITENFISGSLSTILSATYSNNGKIKVFGNFTYSIFENIDFKDGYVYKYDEAEEPNNYIGTYSTWKVDVTYLRPILSKTNFRGGDFEGNWNGGLFGRGDKKITWKGINSIWKNGTLLNTKWLSGEIKSDFTQLESYYVDLDGGLPSQKINGPNNNSKGYNYIIDSEIINSSQIERGTIIGSKLGIGTTKTVVENGILGASNQYDVFVNGAYFEDSEFKSVSINNSELRNSRVKWSLLDNVKFINSYVGKSWTKNSDYIADNIIKITDFSDLLINLDSSISGDTHRIFKFYINENSYLRLKSGDTFYIRGVDISGQLGLLNFFDKKFRISSWYEYSDSLSIGGQFYKRGVDCAAFLSTPEENKLHKNEYSIDIIYSLYDIDNLPVDNFTGTPNISSAYIIDADYESGLIQNSNWNSRYYMNSNNDLNITKPLLSGGVYDMILKTSSSTLLVNTGYNGLWRENSEDFLEVGDVIFLNSVSYDTMGKILSFTLSNNGTGYINSQYSVSGSGTGSLFNITANQIGSVIGLTLSSGGFSYTDGPPGSGSYSNIATIGGSGSGLTVNITVTASSIESVSINNSGTGYIIGNTVSVVGNPSGVNAILTIESVTNGEISSVDLISGGIGFSSGETITLLGGNSDATIDILSTTGSISKLPDSYKIINIINNTLELSEVVNGTSSLSSLLDGGTFYTPGARNRWGYLHSLKINKNLIKSGFLKRVYLKNNLIKNDTINLLDKDFNNKLQFKNLIISDSLFVDNSNILSTATYIQSSFVEGTDYWDDGLFYNSVWNNGVFRKGLFKESSWHDGKFINGTFYSSKTFNAVPSINSPYYDVDNIKSYWKSGETGTTISNDRWSWRSGTFSGGDFIKSDWENGQFINGNFWNSKWYGGTFYNGIIGKKSIPFEDTIFYNGLIKKSVVENATIYAEDTSLFGLSQSNIIWETGQFNGGIFGCDIILQPTASHTATWYNGQFNSGEFRTNGKWIDGQFNGGKFISGFGWTWSQTIDSISTSASQFAWEGGEFNGGQFGNGELGTNSTWWSGQFNGGEFKGRYWNDGIFTGGRFLGSATYSAVGGYSVDSMELSNAQSFIESFSQSFYGVWGGGWSSDVKDDFIKDRKIFTTPIRSVVSKLPKTVVEFNNMLWLSGTFSHPGGTFKNSVWLDGSFNRGLFSMSSFNPWVTRPGDLQKSFNLNDDLAGASGSCIWLGGTLEESEFYMSQWLGGRFISGTAFGMVWKNGVSDYMDAWNVFWENGTWRNGNWNGSFIDVHPTGGVYLQETSSNGNDNFHNQILYRGMNWNGTSSVHLWNVFEDQSDDLDAQGEILAATPSSGLVVTFTPPSFFGLG